MLLLPDGIRPKGKVRTMKRNVIALVCVFAIAFAMLLSAGIRSVPTSGSTSLEQSSSQIVELGNSAASTSHNDSNGNGINDDRPLENGGGDPPREPEYVPGEILVGLAEGATAEQLNGQLASMDYVSTRSISEDDIMLGYVKLELAEGVSVEDAAARVKNERLVKAAQPNYVYYAQDTSPEDAGYSATNLQAGDVDESELTGQSTVIDDHRRRDQWALEAVHAYEAWDTVRVEGRVTVAVVDSGVNGNHEDLQGRVLAGYNAIDKNATVTDDTGHGTHIAGIIAATANNSKGVAGVSYNANILPVKVMEGNKTSTETVLAGMTYVAGLSGSNAPRVMNISIGSSTAWTDGTDDALVTALGKVHAKGILVVYAAANKTSGTATEAWESYPCDFDLNSAGNAGHPDSIGVINAQQSGSSYKRNNSSNFNTPDKKTKTLCAPGSSILSTSNGGGYVNMSGTSMAAPYVAGVAALVFAANPSLRASDVKTILEDTATDVGSEGWDDETGYGMVNAAGAVREAAGRSGGVGVGPTLNGSKSVNVGQAASLQVSDGGSRTWTWTSSAGGVAVVEGNGTTATVLGVGAGQATITATSSDGIQLSHAITVQGAAGVLTNAQVTLSQSQYDYTGAECKPTPTVRVTESGTVKTLTENVDYTVSYSNNVNATTMAVVYITGKGTYASSGTLARVFTINAVPISSLQGLNVQVVETPTYDGSAKTPDLAVTANGGKDLVKGVDYIVKDSDYTNNTNVTTTSSKAHVVITGAGNYTGSSESYDFDILPATITKVELSQSTYIYSGSVCTPTVKVYGPKNGKANQLLTERTDYTVDTPSGRKAVGTYTYTVHGKGNYTGNLSTTLEVTKETLGRVVVAPAEYIYDGTVKTPTVTVYGRSGRRLIEGQDFVMNRPNGRINVGTYTYTATPINGIEGTVKSGSFTIKQGSLGSVTVSSPSYVYDGGTKNPTVTVTNSSGKKLVEGEDYILTKPSGRTNAGTYTYTARPINNYGGASKSATMTITQQSLKNAQVTLSYNSTVYDGSSKKPAVTVTVAGRRLTQGSDYTVSYSNNVKAGSATVSVKGKGNYAGTATTSFRILLAPACTGATEVPVGATASYALTNGGSIAIKSGGSFASLSGTKLTGKAPGTVVLSVRDSAGVERSTKTVKVYSLDGSWELRSAMNSNMVLDINGAGIGNGAGVIIWNRNGGANQRFRFASAGSGRYSLEMVHSGKRVDVDGASRARGHEVIQWPANGGANQQWTLTVDKDNYVTLTSCNSGMVIDVDGAKAVAGRRVIQWPANGGKNQKWKLVKCSTSAPLPKGEGGYRLRPSSASGLAVDVAGASGSSGANVGLWTANGGANQRFQVVDCGSGYVRVCAYHSGQVLDVSGGSARFGANVIQWPWKGAANQKWKVVRNRDGTYSFLSAAGQGYALTWSGSARSGANLQLAPWTAAGNQKFTLQGV